MRILFVAMANIVHTARWLRQLDGQGWDIHLFSVATLGIHPDLDNVTVHDLLSWRPREVRGGVRLSGIPWPFPRGARLLTHYAEHYRPSLRAASLAHVIRYLKPDIVHSLEFQHAGYLTMEARARLGHRFPKWIVTNWGSDIYLFGRLSEHMGRIKAILGACDYYWCECQRDVRLARQMGLRAEVLPVVPNTGGFDLDNVDRLRTPGPSSSRRLILLKGYQGWAGRALVALRAIELCSNELAGYRVAIYYAAPEVKIAAELLAQSTGIPVEIVPPSSHEDILHLFGSARVYIGLSISDAISTSLLEAMVMGAFPIQSCTACADEWLVNGKTGFIVPPDDPEPVATAIRRALAEDALVDHAADQNARVAAERLDNRAIRSQVIALYEKVATGATWPSTPIP